ncbi:type II secretion system F family protein [Candidatus Pacearchaeota archaeon]|nr:type II secretion system F family protein [Candidatus Pacearchaeota archaeon]
MELKKIHLIGIMVALTIIGMSFFISESRFFFLILGIGVISGILPFVLSLMKEARDSSEKEQMFLEFSRNLVESVKTGTPISKSIVNIKDKPYGVLSQHINKLANQIYMGIPLSLALQVFSKDVNNKTISRAITLIGQAEKSGGEIGEILESVAGAVNTSDKLKKERKAVISTLVVQGYIIFFVFMIIVLVMQFKIIPLLSGIQGTGSLERELGVSTQFENIQGEVTNSFLYLILIQGLFSGLAIGKLAEGSLKSGVKHSFALMLMAFVISSVANIFLGG